jgi:two-component system, NarL family, sensor histidine kinase UhpB
MQLNWKNLLQGGPEAIDPIQVKFRDVPLAEIAITFSYVALAGLWIIFSDEMIGEMMGQPETTLVQSFKGLNFVFTTGVLLYLVLRRSFRNRRLAEEALRVSQERFEAVALATTDAIWDWNMETNVVWWSDGVQKLFGYKAEDISSKVDWWRDRLHPDDKERVTQTIRRVVERGGQSWAGHYRFRRQDGTYALVLDRGYVIHNAQGKPTRIAGGVTDITERRKAEEALESSRQQLRALAGRLQSAREEERSSVAREIHDELGQVLTALKLNLDWLERKISEREGSPSINLLLDRVVASGEIVETAISGVQRIAADLRPEILDHLGLVEALQEEATKFQERSGVRCTLALPPPEPELPAPITTAVFRIFQEALTNVARHAQASALHAALQRDAQYLTLDIEDDGRGISVEALADDRALGLLGMRERAAALGGTVNIAPIQPHGTRVSLRLPLAQSGAAVSA